MNQFVRLRTTAVVASTLMTAVPSNAQERGNGLEHLLPFTGKEWVCTSWDGAEPTQAQNFRWDLILDGNAVRETMEVPDIGFLREVLFYWDEELRQLVSLTVTNNGFVGHATVFWEDGKLVTLGRIITSDGGIMEQKETLELLPDRSLRRTSFRQSGSGWEQQHVLEFATRGSE